MRHLVGEHHGGSVSTGHVWNRGTRRHFGEEKGADVNAMLRCKARIQSLDAKPGSPPVEDRAVRRSLGDSVRCALVRRTHVPIGSQEKKSNRNSDSEFSPTRAPNVETANGRDSIFRVPLAHWMREGIWEHFFFFLPTAVTLTEHTARKII